MINHDAEAMLPLNFGSGRYGKIPDMPSIPPPPQPKAPERDTMRRELDRVQRQLEGLTKVVKKLKEAT